MKIVFSNTTRAFGVCCAMLLLAGTSVAQTLTTPAMKGMPVVQQAQGAVLKAADEGATGSVASERLPNAGSLALTNSNDKSRVNAGQSVTGNVANRRVEPVAMVVANEPPTDFQRFVEQSSGQLLPVYGAGLFNGGRFDAVQETQVPDGYVVGPGDELVLQIYGAIDYAERVAVDRDGRILLPKVGPIKVAGLRFGQLEPTLTRHIGEVYRNFKLTVSMGRLRSVEIYVLGQAREPGRKVVGSLSTLINALFETGGPSARGSMRAIELRRAGKLVTRLDLYDFIAKGDSQADRTLEPGDIIFIPPVGPQVAMVGSVNEPAIYELAPGGGTVQSLLALTGGLPAIADPKKAQLERLSADRQPARYVQDIVLDAKGLATPLKAGDVVTVLQISPQFSNAVTLQGSVAAPMRFAYRDGMRVSDLVANNNFLVPVSYWLRVNAGTRIPGLDQPEVNLDYATVQRLDPTRLRTETVPFHLTRALLGDSAENLLLKPGDLVRIYGAAEPTQDALLSVTINAGFLEGGGVRRKVWREGYRISDVIPDLRWLEEEITRSVRNTGVAVTVSDLKKGVPGAIKGQELSQRAANSTDTLEAPEGGSQDAGRRRLSVASVQELNLMYADVRRLDPLTLQVQLIPFNLAQALAGDASNNVRLQPGDRISLYTKQEVAVPIAKQTRLVRVMGEVGVPGTYQVQPGDSLKSVITRAGGFTKQAYPYGTVFTRETTRLEQQRNLARLIHTLETELGNQTNAAAQNGSKTDNQQLAASIEFQRQMLDRLRNSEVTGRIALDMDEKSPLSELPALELEDGDTVMVPTQTDFVSAFGAVDIPNAMIYRRGQTVRDYLERAGLRPHADLDNVAVLKADGTVRTTRTVSVRSNIFGLGGDGKLLDQEVRPGDAILVPEKVDRQTGYTVFMNAAKDWTQLIYQLGLGAAALQALRQ